ncbi:MAG: ECF-type sigma factor [Woeseiaceae bacterium]
MLAEREAGLQDSSDITRLLAAASEGDYESNDALFSVVYGQLREIARAQRRRWAGNHTLDTSALVNEAYLKLAGHQLSDFKNRGHFFATAARAMRQVLINYAERMASAKRGGGVDHATLSGVAGLPSHSFEELLEIDRLLQRLESENPRHCRLFECRVFGGMTIAETADALDLSPATIKRDWALVSAWIYRELGAE